MLRKAGERTVSGLWHLIGKLVDIFKPTDPHNVLTTSVPANIIQSDRKLPAGEANDSMLDANPSAHEDIELRAGQPARAARPSSRLSGDELHVGLGGELFERRGGAAEKPF